MNRYELILALEDIEGGGDPEVSITYSSSVGDPRDEPQGLLRYEMVGATYVVSTENNGVYNKVRSEVDADSDGVIDIKDEQILCALATAFARLNLEIPVIEPIEDPIEEPVIEESIKEPGEGLAQGQTDRRQQPR